MRYAPRLLRPVLRAVSAPLLAIACCGPAQATDPVRGQAVYTTPNHRSSTHAAVQTAMPDKGWVREGLGGGASICTPE